jgi:hypothetical protein
MKKTRITIACACTVAAAFALAEEVHTGIRNPIRIETWNLQPCDERTEHRRTLIEKYRAEIDSLAKSHADEIRKKSASHGTTVEYGYAIYYVPKTGKIKTTSVSKGLETDEGFVWDPNINAFPEVVNAEGVVLAVNHSHPLGLWKTTWQSSGEKKDAAKMKLSFSGSETRGGDIKHAVAYGVLCYMAGYDESLAVFNPYSGEINWLIQGNLEEALQSAVYVEMKYRLAQWFVRQKNSGATKVVGIKAIKGERVPPTETSINPKQESSSISGKPPSLGLKPLTASGQPQTRVSSFDSMQQMQDRIDRLSGTIPSGAGLGGRTAADASPSADVFAAEERRALSILRSNGISEGAINEFYRNNGSRGLLKGYSDAALSGDSARAQDYLNRLMENVQKPATR